jgi:hypothetical protein
MGTYCRSVCIDSGQERTVAVDWPPASLVFHVDCDRDLGFIIQRAHDQAFSSCPARLPIERRPEHIRGRRSKLNAHWEFIVAADVVVS